MSETEQLMRFPVPEAATPAGVVDPSARLARPVRLWAATICGLTVLNLALALWFVALTGDVRTFFSHQLLTPFLAILYALLGVVVSARRPRNPIGWLFLIVASSYVLSAWAAGAELYSTISPAPIAPLLLDLAYWLSNWAWLPAQILPVTFVFLLFPDGHLPSPRWRPIGWAAGLGLALLMLGLAAHPGPVSDWGTRPNPFGVAGTEAVLNGVINAGAMGLMVGALGSMLAIVVRFRRSHGLERAQMKWLVYAAVVVLILGVFVTPIWLSGGLSDDVAMELSIVLTSLMTLGIAVAVTGAVVRYRLYDIDVIINRTLVYGVMTGVVLLIYWLVVSGAGVLFESQGNWLLALLATGLVAILFQPIHARLQRGVNRLLYGQRNEPLEALAQLGQRLEQTLTPDSIYPTIVETVAQVLRLPYVALQVCQGERFATVEAHGRSVAEPMVLPLTNQGEVVGRLLVAPRSGDEGFSEADQQLLQSIARQAGAAVYGAKLTTDLQRSRQQLVTGREEERRRLRRDLHDGLGPSLASLLLQARVLQRLIPSDPAAAERLAGEMQGDIRATIDDIRRVVHELRPPALDDLGLVPALNVLAAKIGRQEGRVGETPAGLRVAVDAPHDLPALPAAVEVAAYRIVQEALTNVVHHAQARSAVVRLRFNGALRIEVADDGVGFAVGRAGGLGLHSMRERAAELGGTFSVAAAAEGGTVVRAALPVEGV
ncbi:MAG: GAF domain-containing protein [Candidatus Promineofilum sp.]|nr:GAF domain-containing protein [Promineifilum sp.]